MKIARGPRDRDFGEGKAAQEGRYRGCVFVPLSGIADEREVGFELIAVCGEEWGEARASQFLLALEEHADIDRQGSMRGEPGSACLDERHDLAFVVGGAARNDHHAVTRVLDKTRREGRSIPFFQRIGGLHVVMAVEQHVPPRFAFLLRAPMPDDHRLAKRWLDARAEADLAQRGGAPFGCGKATVMMGGVG